MHPIVLFPHVAPTVSLEQALHAHHMYDGFTFSCHSMHKSCFLHPSMRPSILRDANGNARLNSRSGGRRHTCFFPNPIPFEKESFAAEPKGWKLNVGKNVLEAPPGWQVVSIDCAMGPPDWPRSRHREVP